MTPATPTIEEFGRKLRAREISAVEITDDCLRRVDADNGRLNAFILVMTDEARRQAREADRELAAGAIVARCTARPSPSRICSTSAARPRPRRHSCVKAISRIATRPRSPTFAAPARS